MAAIRLPSLESPRSSSASNSTPHNERPSAEAIDRALELAEAGAELTASAAESLLHARGEQLDRLLAAAGEVRDVGLLAAGRPGVLTYSRKVFIPLTHLCQDRCHYCIFVQTPGKLAKAGKSPFLSPEEILEIARAGAALGCKEALFTLGDRPENRWEVAREWLTEHGYKSTIEYLRAMAILVLEETGLLPHLNPGVMTWSEIQRLKPVAPSMGMMLETTATRLWSEKGGAHFGSPDKDPAIRLRVLDDAGRSQVPFTTGVLLGIGENYAERVDAMFAIRDSANKYGHVQEVIVQNFRAKEATAMMGEDDLETLEYAAAVAVTRLVMGASARIQAPPNLTDAGELSLLIRAGIDDWGGVSPLTPDHVNPERPWPQIDELTRLTKDNGFELHERLTAHPHFIRDHDTWLDPRVVPHLMALVDPATGLAQESAMPIGQPWRATVSPGAVAHVSGEARAALRRAEIEPASLSDSEYEALLGADGAELEALTELADGLRREAVGDAVSFVVDRNIDSSRIGLPRDTDGRTLSLPQLGSLVDEAWELGATEVCIQGGLRPEVVGISQLDVARQVKIAQPRMHLHAFRPVEIVDGARRSGLPLGAYLDALAESGVDTVPGTGARILNDRIRDFLSDGGELSVAQWIDVITTAHTHGLRSTATMVYGHIETPADVVAHLRTLSRIQDETGGFTEFIPMPFVPADVPITIADRARPGPSAGESRAVHAVSRLMLNGRIDHIQAAWTKLGIRGAQRVLMGGADDLGGTFVAGYLRPDAGAEEGRELTATDVERIAAEIDRPARQRTTTYDDVHADRLSAALDAARSHRAGPGSSRTLQLSPR